MVLSWHIGSAGNLEAGSTLLEIPVAASESGRDCSSSVVLCPVRVAGWSCSESVGVAVNLLVVVTEPAAAGTARAVPVASGAGPRCTCGLESNGADESNSEVFHGFN